MDVGKANIIAQHVTVYNAAQEITYLYLSKYKKRVKFIACTTINIEAAFRGMRVSPAKHSSV